MGNRIVTVPYMYSSWSCLGRCGRVAQSLEDVPFKTETPRAVTVKVGIVGTAQREANRGCGGKERVQGSYGKGTAGTIGPGNSTPYMYGKSKSCRM